MCQAWSVSFQKGMHYHLRPNLSVLLVSRRQSAPYGDRIEETGRVLVYEGHDVSHSQSCPKPKSMDQPSATPSGRLTRGTIYRKATRFSESPRPWPRLYPARQGAKSHSLFPARSFGRWCRPSIVVWSPALTV